MLPTLELAIHTPVTTMLNSMRLAAFLTILLAVLGGWSLPHPRRSPQPAPHAQTVNTDTAKADEEMCPILRDQPVDKNIHVTWNGKRYFFCCDSCKAAFELQPEMFAR
ncbi:MAG TPA: YHS domain-containing protein [Planctomycetota bacterium]|nr:YHS domain-containing protein [Planctomycetota bacterium]